MKTRGFGTPVIQDALFSVSVLAACQELNAEMMRPAGPRCFHCGVCGVLPDGSGGTVPCHHCERDMAAGRLLDGVTHDGYPAAAAGVNT